MVSNLKVIFVLPQQPAHDGLDMKCISWSWLKIKKNKKIKKSSHIPSQGSLQSDSVCELQAQLAIQCHEAEMFIPLWLIFLGTSNKLKPLQLEALLTEGSPSTFWLVGSIGLVLKLLVIMNFQLDQLAQI